MSKLDIKLYKIENLCNEGYWSERILGEIKYALQLSDTRKVKYDKLVEKVIDFIAAKVKDEKNLSMQTAAEAEEMLLPLREDAKKYKVFCVGHAHIDMNWLWRFDETVSITLDTFRTMLMLLKEYPQFTFAQSQASVYKILELYGTKEMLKEIKKYIKEGRWDVTASTWVEADKNMPNGESMARHLLYSRRFLSRLLDIPAESIRIDFEPDTFGHSLHNATALADAGVEYFYHCRGSVDPALVWWEAPSGKRVLAFRDDKWYNADARSDFGTRVISYCDEVGVDAILKVYGVGDHGGGPTRRDIERILDMQTWPVFPEIIFSTYHKYFDYIKENFGDKLPVRTGEMNPLFTGCYSSQSRIKLSNRVGEATLNEAELFGAFASKITKYTYKNENFENSWQNILFNQFHDILTGSGLMETREYAMGIFQKAMSVANTQKLEAMRTIAANIDSSKYIVPGDDKSDFRSEGAGVGFGVEQFKVSQSDNGCGSIRVFHIFNPSAYEREGLADITVWDWHGDKVPLMEFRDSSDKIIPHQLNKSDHDHYWGHNFAKVLLPVIVPAMGYATYTLRESDTALVSRQSGRAPSLDHLEVGHEFILENNKVKVVFNTQNAKIVSYYDKVNGFEWIKPGTSAGFRFIEEDTNRGMTAWRIGRHMNIIDFDSVHITPVYPGGTIMRQYLEVKIPFRGSILKATISLDDDCANLVYAIECDWRERAMPGESIPQLSFAVELNENLSEYTYDIPFGIMSRESNDCDLPANSFIAALPKSRKNGFMLSTDSKYGYRGFNNSMAVTLIRTSYDPDPTPEYGKHAIRLSIGLCERSNKELLDYAYDLWHPFNIISDNAHKGTLPLVNSLASVNSDDVMLSAVKLSEDSGEILVRLYDVSGKGGKAKVVLNVPVSNTAEIVDITERLVLKTLKLKGNSADISVPKNDIVNIIFKQAK